MAGGNVRQICRGGERGSRSRRGSLGSRFRLMLLVPGKALGKDYWQLSSKREGSDVRSSWAVCKAAVLAG